MDNVRGEVKKGIASSKRELESEPSGVILSAYAGIVVDMNMKAL